MSIAGTLLTIGNTAHMPDIAVKAKILPPKSEQIYQKSRTCQTQPQNHPSSSPPSPSHPIPLPRPHTLRPPLDTWPARTWAPHPPTMPPRAAARPLEAPGAAPYPRAPTWSRAGYTKKGAGMRGTRRKLAFMGDVPVSIMISYHIISYHIISYHIISICLSVCPSVRLSR